MIGKIRAIQILSGVVAGLLVCYAALVFYEPAAGEQGLQEETVYAVTDIPVNQVAAVKIVNAKGKFAVLTKGQELEMVSAVTGSYSQTELRSLVYGASHMTGNRKITDLSKGEEYGINDPAAQITLMLTDGSQKDFSLLKQSPLDGRYYLYAEEEKAIYLIAEEVAALFLRQEQDFITHTVLPAVDGTNYRQLEWAEVSFNGQGTDYRITQKDGTLWLQEPVSQRLSLVSAVQNFFIPASALYADQFVARGAELSQYGFEDFSLRIRMKYDGQEYGALLLQKEDGTCLMASEQTKDVYQLGGDSLTAVSGDYRKLLEGKAFSYSAGDLNSVSVSVGADTGFVEVSGGKAKGSGKIDGEALLSAAVSGEIAGEVSAEEAGAVLQGAQEPAMSLVFTLTNGSIDTVELLPAPQGGYYVRVNGIINFTTGEGFYRQVKEVVSGQGQME